MPTSVLWVTLIAVWLFVLIPMVLRGRPQARKTTAAAANTRLVHRGGSSRTRASRRALTAWAPAKPPPRMITCGQLAPSFAGTVGRRVRNGSGMTMGTASLG